MLPRHHKADWPERVLVQLPWLGPMLGEPVAENSALQVGACADPLLGDAMGVLFLPVRRRDGRFERAPGSGWAMSVSDPVPVDGRFRVLPPLQWWDGQIGGLLMLLIYDRSPNVPKRIRKREVPISLRQRLENEPAVKSDPTKPWPIGDLPEEFRVPLEYQLEQFLRCHPARDLELGLIELDLRPVPEELTFAVASCQYPANFIDRDVAQRSYERLQARMKDPLLGPRCLLLIGDQVYIDATGGFFDPSTLSDRYDLPYERLLQTKPLRHVLRRVPVYTMLDDHEIEDNWEPPSGSNKNLTEGRKYFLAYQRMAWPLPQPRDPLWYSFDANGFPFFMADTRTERKPRDASCVGTACIMHIDQFTALTGWLDKQDKDVPKFIATPSAFLPRHRKATHGRSGAGALRSDGWDGYPASFDATVKHIADNGIRNVVFLSGDEHFSFVTTAIVSDGDGKEVTRIRSVHSSALYAPFTFANAKQADLACCGSFESGRYRLTVSSEFASAGDGFALLRTWRENGRWRIRCLFDREPPAPEIWIDLA